MQSASPAYRFRYTRGAESAQEKVGFEALPDFPAWKRDYVSPELFPLFRNSVSLSERQDFQDYLRMLDLPNEAEPAEIPEVGGGDRATDNFMVFPKIQRRPDGSFVCRFFLHGSRHVTPKAMC